MNAEIKVFAPASVANVAVGYDIMGFALKAPGDEIIARFSNKPGLSITKITGANGKHRGLRCFKTPGTPGRK